MRIFLDSWGGFWAVCPPTHPKAKAFGPCGVARPCKVQGCGSIAAVKTKGINITLEKDDQGWDWVKTQ